MVEADSGKELWRVPGGGKLMVGGGRVFTESSSSGRHRLTCLDLETGKHLWQDIGEPQYYTTPFYYKGTVVLGDYRYKTICGHSAADGKKLWSVAFKATGVRGRARVGLDACPH